MRGRSCSEQQEQKKDISVYDFGPEELAVEAASTRYRTRRSSSSSSYFQRSEAESIPKEEKKAAMKYTFLQAFTSGLHCKPMDVNCTSPVDLLENDGPQDSFGLDSPERNLASTDERSELGENMISSSSYGESHHVLFSELDTETLVRVDPLKRGATCRTPDLVGNMQDASPQSDGTSVDLISDDEQSCSSGSPTTTATDHAEDEDYSEHHISENCLTGFEQDKDHLAVIVSPDFVIYENNLFGEGKLFFTSDSVLLKCKDVYGVNENFVLEYDTADILHVEQHWSDSVQAALVKFQLKATAVNGIRTNQNAGDVIELVFAVSDMRWHEKERKIKCLAQRYKDIWNAPDYDRSASEDDSVEQKAFFPRHYFAEIPDSFEEVIYPKGDPDAVSISKRDIELLQPDTFLNDTIIDFYIKYLKTSKILPSERHRFHFFNSFFFRKLADMDKDPGSASEGRAAFLRVRKWTRKVNIFEKDYIFIPVNFNLHWSLLVICHPGEVSGSEEGDGKDSPKVPCILHMDSIKGSHSGLKNLVQSYLLEEWKERHPESIEDYTSKFSNLRFVSLELPQQENSFDCGLFLLHYAELFLEKAPVNFSPFKISKFSSFLTADWFIPSEASFKRCLIRKLIYDLLNEPSQIVNPTTCGNDCLSTGNNCSNVEQPTVEFLSKHCSPSKATLDSSTCSLTVKGIEMNLETISASCVVQCEKQERSVIFEFLDTETDSTSLFKEDAPSQTSKSAKGLADTSEQLIALNLDSDYVCPVGESLAVPTCTMSYSDVGGFGMPFVAVEEKEEIELDLQPKTCSHIVPNQNAEMGEEASVLGEDCGYAPDSPISYSCENGQSDAYECQEKKATKTDDGRCRTSQGSVVATDNIQEDIKTAKSNVEDAEKIENSVEDNCHEANPSEAEAHMDTAMEVDGREDLDCQGSDSPVDVNNVKDENHNDARMEVVDGGKDEDCQRREVDGGEDEGFPGSDTHAEVDGGKNENCQGSSTHVEVGSENDETLEGESSLVAAECEGSQQESLPAQNSQVILLINSEETILSEDMKDPVVSDDETVPPKTSKNVVVFDVDENSVVKGIVQKKRYGTGRKIEVTYQKRRKVVQPEGERRRTRSFMKTAAPHSES